ncbi:endonuclease III [Candidatus Uhrbacteria bacterium]|nr:endonuclease III [Candidatus Uhrbacteria bacterium]
MSSELNPQLRERIRAIIAELCRATRSFPKPMGTSMVGEGRTLFQLLVATICSAQTRDATTYPVMQRLFAIVRTPKEFASISHAELERLLYPISYYRTKAKHLRQMSQMLIEQYHGQVPTTMEELLRLPGVGRKTANLVLGEGVGKSEGICVDTHVHRISNRLGLIRTATREATERALMRIMPKRYWTMWNPLLVMWGQNICTPISPKCSQCALRPWCERRGVTTSR